MRLLLDTHAALWWWEDSPLLGARAREAIADASSEIHFSAASAYEIHQKHRLDKLALPGELQGEGLIKSIREEGWLLLPLQVAEATAADSLAHAHRDPFDRMLAAQSRLDGLTLVSRDPFFQEIGLEVLW